MKKATSSKKSSPKKVNKSGHSDSDELRKPAKLKPLKDKEKKKNWKNSIGSDEEEDFEAMPDEDIKFDDLRGSLDDDDEEDAPFFDDDF
ncbi:MAG TPA: hypothetical protein VNG53_09310 [Bacteroidia bacterium]|nr:hypothetical protein [Bacteroidia bacterium]